ncbi:Predicted 2-oxoglutarate-and Fe(II)-dependent dioxygenase YbiX [Singulisphaera sp. GP187]|nr:Predicted 2-oxoglutarate-and Fe(II)-dependent dioxygenase YbiX [Singulisphaera sp. GP187]
MNVAEGIFTVPDLLTLQECQAYIALTEREGYQAAPITTASGFAMRPDIRNNTRVIVDDAARADDLWRRVRDRIPRFFQGRQAIGLNERFRFYRYDPGERFAAHRDGPYRRENGEKSLLTFMIYLSEGFTGGETVFQEVSVTPQLGMALIFEHQLIHEGAAVTSGRKYVLRSDVMYGRVGQIRG